MYRLKSGRQPNGKWPLTTDQKQGDPEIDPVKVPCGRCLSCRLKRSQEWATRCMVEARYHDENCFITLTYRPEELIEGKYAPTLYPKHLTDFWKRLRKELSKDGKLIRYFACGEYGGQSRRPHYHACLFGFDFKDKVYHSTKMGNTLYASRMLNDIWSHGNCTVGAFSFETAAYVARYIVGKQLGATRDFYTDMGIEPEFVRMSRRPGIGTNFYNEFSSQLASQDEMFIRPGVVAQPPKFFLNKIEKDNPDAFAKIKTDRLNAALSIPGSETRWKRLLDKALIRRIRSGEIQRDSI